MTLANLHESLGALFIGSILSGILWGITSLQVFHYYTTRQTDSAYIKATVAVIWASDTTHQVLVLVALYNYCVTHFGNYLYLLTIPRTAPAETAFMQLTAMVVQGFYMLKIWKLCAFGRYRWFMLPISVLYLSELGLAIVTIYIDVTAGYLWTENLDHTHNIAVAYGAITFATDASITGAMCYILWNYRTEYVQTKSIISKLMVFVISSNLLTACCALAVCLIFSFYPHDLYFIPLYFIIVRLYANSLMVALNMRPYLTHDHRAPFEESRTSSRRRSNLSPLWNSHVRSANKADLSHDSHEMDKRGIRVTKVIDIAQEV